MEKTTAARDGHTLTTDHLLANAMFREAEDVVLRAALERAELVYLDARQMIFEPDGPIDEVYFPITAVLSIVTKMKDGAAIEAGTIGREGTSAFPLIIGATNPMHDCFCQVPGFAIKLSAGAYAPLTQNPGFRKRLELYLQTYVIVLTQLAACNRLHSIYERCARWLLMTYDRVGQNSIPLTQEFLAMMLGTGRSGVSIAAGTLQQAGFIRYTHGLVTVTDRQGLESAACECYVVARREFHRLLPETA